MYYFNVILGTDETICLIFYQYQYILLKSFECKYNWRWH